MPLLWMDVLKHPLGISLSVLVVALGAVVGFYHFITVPRLQAAYKLELANYTQAHTANATLRTSNKQLSQSNFLWKTGCGAPSPIQQQQARKKVLAQKATQQQREYAAYQQRQRFYAHNTAGATWAHTSVPLQVAVQFRPPD